MTATQQGEGFPPLPYLHCFGTEINGGFPTNVVNTRDGAVWELSQMAPFNFNSTNRCGRPLHHRDCLPNRKIRRGS